VIGIFADHYLKDGDCVLQRARDWSGNVREQVEWRNAGSTGQPHRRSDANQRLMRRRPANGVSSVTAEADGAAVWGDRRCGTAAGSGSDAIERVRIARVAR